jgi:NAD(P)-dependent dehydrogenase (short-subunit alcohol dehydrogenase family)
MSLRHIVITGGSRGIGLAIAQLFATNNYRCTLISRSEDSLKAAIKSLQPTTQRSTHEQEMLGNHRYIVGDVSDPEFWTHGIAGKALMIGKNSVHKKERAEERTEPKPDSKSDVSLSPGPESEVLESDKVGQTKKARDTIDTLDIPTDADHARKRVDVLVNCAGITGNQLFARMERSVTKDVIDTNLTGLMMGTQYLLRYKFLRRVNAKETYSPTIINVASLLAVQGGFGAVAYAASKAGVLGFTRALALETGRSGVRVNAIVPGYIETDMISGMSLIFPCLEVLALPQADERSGATRF